MSVFSTKKGKVLVVDPSGPVRGMMAEVARTALGFETVESKSSVQDALEHLEIDHADWILTGLMPDQPVNGLHLAKVCSEHSRLKSVRLSLCLEPDELYLLPKAFELGILSYHAKPFTKESLTEQLKALVAQLEGERFQEPLVAAHYLRGYLKTQKSYQALALLEKHLLDLFPGNASVLLNMAEPQFHLGQKTAAQQTLAQVKLLDAKLAAKADALAKALFPDQPGPAAGAEGSPDINVLGAKRIVIIDGDETSGKAVEDIFRHFGVPEIRRFPDGEAAADYFADNAEPDLVVMEWRVPKLSGPMLIQRLRHRGFLKVPIVILSQLLKPEDMPFVREIGVANIILKPLSKETFVPAVIHTLQQERAPTEHQVIERKIRSGLKANPDPEITGLRAQYLAHPEVPLAKKRLIEGEFAYAAGDYPLARDAALAAMKMAGDGILVLNLLGKSFMRLSAFELALKCFNKAQQLAPQNLERLCMIAETQTELGDTVAASDTMATITSLDEDAPQAAEAQVRVAITGGDASVAKKLMAGFESVETIVAYMNNRAVALARSGKPNEAIALYKKTLDSIPDDKPDPRSIILYNLALAQVRDGEYEAAVSKLGEIGKIKDARMAKRGASLKARLEKALAENAPFKLESGDADQKVTAPPPAGALPAEGAPAATPLLASEAEHLAMLAAVEAKPGDLCCFMVFVNPDPTDLRVESLLAKAPRYQPRGAIERAEALGAERSVK